MLLTGAEGIFTFTCKRLSVLLWYQKLWYRRLLFTEVELTSKRYVKDIHYSNSLTMLLLKKKQAVDVICVLNKNVWWSLTLPTLTNDFTCVKEKDVV